MTKKLFDEAKEYIPGGVNSPVRSFKAVSGIPLFVNKALFLEITQKKIKKKHRQLNKLCLI